MESGSSQITLDSLGSLQRQIEIVLYYHLASFVILYFDYILTLDDEIRYFWRHDSKWATRIFLMTRYMALIGHVPVILQNFHEKIFSQKSCHKLEIYHQVFLVVMHTLVGIMLVMRVYGLTQGSKKVLAIILVFSAGGIGVAFWSFIGENSSDLQAHSTEDPTYLTCLPSITQGVGQRLAAAWGGLLVFDSVVILFTLRNARAALKTGVGSLLMVLVRDGAIYFSVLAAANLSNILTFLFAQPLLRGVSSVFANVISVTMVSRLMINLRKRGTYSSSSVNRTDAAGVSALVFASHRGLPVPEEMGTAISHAIIPDISVSISNDNRDYFLNNSMGIVQTLHLSTISSSHEASNV